MMTELSPAPQQNSREQQSFLEAPGQYAQQVDSLSAALIWKKLQGDPAPAPVVDAVGQMADTLRQQNKLANDCTKCLGSATCALSRMKNQPAPSAAPATTNEAPQPQMRFAGIRMQALEQLKQEIPNVLKDPNLNELIRERIQSLQADAAAAETQKNSELSAEAMQAIGLCVQASCVGCEKADICSNANTDVKEYAPVTEAKDVKFVQKKKSSSAGVIIFGEQKVEPPSQTEQPIIVEAAKAVVQEPQAVEFVPAAPVPKQEEKPIVLEQAAQPKVVEQGIKQPEPQSKLEIPVAAPKEKIVFSTVVHQDNRQTHNPIRFVVEEPRTKRETSQTFTSNANKPKTAENSFQVKPNTQPKAEVKKTVAKEVLRKPTQPEKPKKIEAPVTKAAAQRTERVVTKPFERSKVQKVQKVERFQQKSKQEKVQQQSPTQKKEQPRPVQKFVQKEKSFHTEAKKQDSRVVPPRNDIRESFFAQKVATHQQARETAVTKPKTSVRENIQNMFKKAFVQKQESGTHKAVKVEKKPIFAKAPLTFSVARPENGKKPEKVRFSLKNLLNFKEAPKNAASQKKEVSGSKPTEKKSLFKKLFEKKVAPVTITEKKASPQVKVESRINIPKRVNKLVDTIFRFSAGKKAETKIQPPQKAKDTVISSEKKVNKPFLKFVQSFQKSEKISTKKPIESKKVKVHHEVHEAPRAESSHKLTKTFDLIKKRIEPKISVLEVSKKSVAVEAAPVQEKSIELQQTEQTLQQVVELLTRIEKVRKIQLTKHEEVNPQVAEEETRNDNPNKIPYDPTTFTYEQFILLLWGNSILLHMIDIDTAVL